MSEGLDLDSRCWGYPNAKKDLTSGDISANYGCRCLGRWRKSCASKTVQEARFALNCSYVDLEDIERLIFKRMM